MNTRTIVQSVPATSVVQTSIIPFTQASISTPSTINTTIRTEKPSNGTSISQNNRFMTSTPLTVTPYHIPRGTAAVASISVPKGKLSSPIIRTTPIQTPPSTTVSVSTTQGFISSMSRPVTTWVVTSTSSNILQKTAALNIVSSTYVRPPSTMTVTSRTSTPVVSKASEITVKPIILQNTPKQLITQTTNQLADRNTGGLVKTNVGMVTIRGSTITPTLQPQTRVPVSSQNSQSSRLAVSVPMLVPTSAVVRKPQTLAPKIITQSTRAPFTVQSIPVSVNQMPSALTVNKKTATIANCQATVPGQSTTSIIRANSTVVASNSMITVTEIRPEVRPTAPPTSLLIQASSKPQNTAPNNVNVTAFSAPAKTYVYDTTENFQVKRTLVSSATTAFTSSVASLTTTSIPRHFNVVSSVNTNQIPRLNPIMVVEAPRMATSVTPPSPPSVQSPALTIQSYVLPQGTALVAPVHQPQLPPPPPSQPVRISPIPQTSTTIKSNASPRPSILRKRDIDGSLAKAQRNLTPFLNSAPGPSTTVPSPPPSPHLPEMGGGLSSNSSSTLSATSSPGIPNIDPESPTPKIERPHISSHLDEEHLRTASLIEMSPRKKPRKQQLTSNITNEPKLEDDMEFICDGKIKKESKDNSDTMSLNQESQKVSSSASSKKPNISILTGYNHGWKSRHHHFLRYSDVKYKEEKKPSVSDIANQKYVTQKINGWKIYRLSAQMEDLHDIEIEVIDKLSSLLKLFTHTPEDDDKSLNRTNELIMGNMQRSKVVSDQLREAKSQMMKVFNHKKHVSDIINKYASKRTIKKKGRY